jgi:trimethylamine--corrinoid protein Co-methyltransferase
MSKGLQGGSLGFLEEADVERIHTAALTLLRNHGVLSESDLILDLFQRGGADVDRGSRTIRLLPDMVAAALKSAPRSFTFHGRDPQFDLPLEPGRVYYGMGGTSEPLFWDYSLGKARAPTKADMVVCTQVGQHLSHIDFVMALCSAGDVPGNRVFLHEYDAIFRNTTKPVLYTAPGGKYTATFLEMAAAACGGENEFRRRPWVMLFTQTIAPLKIGSYSEGMVQAAEFGVPILASTGPMMGATGPVTMAGELAQTHAEALFGIVMSQLIKPGTPVVYGPHVAAMDMSTGQCTYGSPEQSLGRTAIAQIGRFLKLPTFGLGGGVEAKLPDAEAAAEAMMGMLLNALAGLTLTQCLGTLASGSYGSPEMLLICDEIAHMIERVMAGIQVNDETLALDVIEEVGFQGNFLTHRHTMRFFREELFLPQLFRRQGIDQWVARGCRPIVDTAHERIRDILAKAGPVPLPPGADEELQRVLHQAIEGLTAQPS